MKLGISSYTFGWAVGVNGFARSVSLNERDLLDMATRENIGVLQIGDNLPLHTIHHSTLADFGAAAKERNVQLEIGARRLVPERIAQYAEVARTVGARLIRFVIDDADYRPDPNSIIDILKDSARLLNGLVLGIENHDRFQAKTLRHIIEASADERIGVCLDTANSLGAGEGIEIVAETLAPLTINLHIKDFWIERVPYLMGFNVTGRPAGSGMLNVRKLLETLAPHNRCETAVLELWTPPEARIEDTVAKEARWASESLKYLKPFFT
ncbi:MAG TPA: TIM barrel protein [Verrucomicrobiae bacterium]|nr:TIM barrel protein [Verrucomicrobiae bacterium]